MTTSTSPDQTFAVQGVTDLEYYRTRLIIQRANTEILDQCKGTCYTTNESCEAVLNVHPRSLEATCSPSIFPGMTSNPMSGFRVCKCGESQIGARTPGPYKIIDSNRCRSCRPSDEGLATIITRLRISIQDPVLCLLSHNWRLLIQTHLPTRSREDTPFCQ